MTTDKTCGGECCAVFWLPKDALQPDGMKGVRDGEFIADMIVPLNRRQALRRWRKFVSTTAPLPKGRSDRTTYTCRHWDEKTRLCGVYEDRPGMCRDYPYGAACSHGCDYQVDDTTAQRHGNGTWKWDDEAKGWRPRSTANFLWDAEQGVLKPIPKDIPA